MPNGVLFGDGIAARIKEELLREFNLHTIVRLPNGVFEPYTPIPTNILFFDRRGTTGDVWFYEQPVGDGKKKYSKTNPLVFEEFGAALTWWRAREENACAWKLSAEVLLKRGCNLDVKNPRAPADVESRASSDVLAAIAARQETFDRALKALRAAADGGVQ